MLGCCQEVDVPPTKVIRGVVLVGATRVTKLIRGSFKTFTSCSRMGRRILAYCKEDPIKVEEEIVSVVFRLVETPKVGGIGTLGGAEELI
ncbi:hypothetical protein PVK06_039672 [Gossypium arboreum]|uniref:Uncharacterized protein n=1 Tax=Gossypium arboreum TaxID=29729 RepID=A0ABR0N3H7_GOSAR|nr:hypothetical protein PVK06_039672 [Gossypium arboreum]